MSNLKDICDSRSKMSVCACVQLSFEWGSQSFAIKWQEGSRESFVISLPPRGTYGFTDPLRQHQTGHSSNQTLHLTPDNPHVWKQAHLSVCAAERQTTIQERHRRTCAWGQWRDEKYSCMAFWTMRHRQTQMMMHLTNVTRDLHAQHMNVNVQTHTQQKNAKRHWPYWITPLNTNQENFKQYYY